MALLSKFCTDVAYESWVIVGELRPLTCELAELLLNRLENHPL
jgi:hypothetical protein